jgi:heterotetrameric sarcosine oxidase gamma subunit
VIQVATWPTGTEAWLAALTSALGEGLPPRVGDTQRMPAGLVMRVGPEEIMIVSEETAPASAETVAALRQQLRPDICSVLDLSHARCRIRIEGEHCVDTLAKLFALDFRDDAFPIDRVQLTSHHHVPCALHRTGATAFDAYVFTTFAREQLETFADAALEFGVVVAAR